MLKQGLSFNLIDSPLTAEEVFKLTAEELARSGHPEVNFELVSLQEEGDGITEVTANLLSSTAVDFDDYRDALEIQAGVYDVTAKEAGTGNFRHFAF